MFRSLRVSFDKMETFRETVTGKFHRQRIVGPVFKRVSVYNLGLEVVFQVVPVLYGEHPILGVLSKEVVEHLEAFLQLEVGTASRTRLGNNEFDFRNQLLLPVFVFSGAESEAGVLADLGLLQEVLLKVKTADVGNLLFLLVYLQKVRERGLPSF